MPPPSGVNATRKTLSVAIVALGDIPTLLDDSAQTRNARGEAESPSVAPLLLAINGDSTVAEIADRLHIEPEQARAMIAELVDRGVVALSRKPASSSGVGAVRASTPRSLEYWLAGLKPRTK